MTDIWCVLLQTLNVSGAAALLLAVKAIFRDKLPPKWQFGIWGILAAVMLVPAGMGGRQLLVPWAKLVELVKVLCGELEFSAVTTPLPLLSEQPKDIFDWLYVLYFTGVLIQLGFYGTAYVRLRRVLNRGREIRDGKYEEFYRMGCRVMAVDGLSSAFVCGLFRPILAVPAEQEPGDQVLLHEKLHLKNRDTAWSVVICLFKSLHWCNPFLRWCAGVAGNDLEARCDQQVLERLEGEQRRAYGRTLLAMANDRHARIPGATAVNNGGKNIRRRIESIARFRRYPAGMGLVSVCAALLLAAPMVMGTELSGPPADALSVTAYAAARAGRATTAAGAFDCYAKAVMTRSPIYRAMCAPEGIQPEIYEGIRRGSCWNPGLPGDPMTDGGYYLYNMTETVDGFEALLVLTTERDGDNCSLALQNVRVYEENGYWYALPLDAFRSQTVSQEQVSWGDASLPGIVYRGVYEDLVIETRFQTIHEVDSWRTEQGFLFSSRHFDTTPQPHTVFREVRFTQHDSITHTGTQEARDAIDSISIFVVPIYGGTADLQRNDWSRRELKDGWGPTVAVGGSGTSRNADDPESLPDGCLAYLYINSGETIQVELSRMKGGPQ